MKSNIAMFILSATIVAGSLIGVVAVKSTAKQGCTCSTNTCHKACSTGGVCTCKK